MGRVHKFFLDGLIGQTKHWEMAQKIRPGIRKWRWRFARAYYAALVGFRHKTGYYIRRDPTPPNPTAE